MTNAQTEVAARFVSLETEAAYVSGIVQAAGKHAKADRNLVASLLASARLIGRPVSEADWTEALVSPLRKAIKAKVSADSVKVYVSHAKTVTLAACGRPPISDALPLGKHWADQRTGRKPEGVNAYVKRVGALLKLAEANAEGVLILPEGYDLMGNAPKAATPPAATEPAATIETAGDASKAEGGINVTPEKAKEDARVTAATVLMGNVKAANALLALLADETGRKALAELMAKEATRKAMFAKAA